ncbi:MAG: hypothetical protein HY547_03860 [Elusimicrobia bacterium]|nr:hypothetical protein [Elusimicrobiota bacterium]
MHPNYGQKICKSVLIGYPKPVATRFRGWQPWLKGKSGLCMLGIIAKTTRMPASFLAKIFQRLSRAELPNA